MRHSNDQHEAFRPVELVHEPVGMKNKLAEVPAVIPGFRHPRRPFTGNPPVSRRLTGPQFAAKIATHAAAGSLTNEVGGGRFADGFWSAGFTQAVSPVIGKLHGTSSGIISAAIVGGTASKLSGGKFANGASSTVFLSVMGLLYENATRVTDELKMRAFESQTKNAPQVLEWDERGVLRTDGTRGTYWGGFNPSEEGNFITRGGMEAEGSGMHWYDDGHLLASPKAIRYFVTDVSKIHDWFNSVNYTDNGLYLSRGEAFDTVFQAYSFSGMPLAAAATLLGYSYSLTLQQKVHIAVQYGGNR